MAIRRYRNDLLIKAGTMLATNESIRFVRSAVDSGNVLVTTRVLKEGERLDTIAGKLYGDGSLWWVIAAASGIGWWLQVPPGTLLTIPTDLNYIKSKLG
jgi:nucleoid-associated protein YgaU